MFGIPSQINCTRMAASRMQIVPEWRLVAYKLHPSGSQSLANFTRVAASRMQIPVNFIHVACD